MKQEDVQFTLDDGPDRAFEGATLQIENEMLTKSQDNAMDSSLETLLNGNAPKGAESPNKKARPNTLALVPWSGENAKDFFCYRNGLVSNAVGECKKEVLTPDDGELIGSWLLTEISFWDNEKERLVLLTTRMLITVKYDFIALKQLDYRKVPLDVIDTVIVGDLAYPPISLIPHIDGLATGVTSIVKGCLVRPLQERWAGMPSACTSANTFRINNFEARSRNLSGVRTMWNQGKPLSFIRKWNPFEKDIPFNTFTSHPLLWHTDDDNGERKIYNVDDFLNQLIETMDRRIKTFQCSVQHKPILLENYLGLGALIHNKNSLGFFKVRGKFSF
ncbi:tumor protein p63-regulated gene 1-like protein isoform X1 [Rhodnius prolixus]